MTTPTAEQNDFIEVIQLIEAARQRVNYSVNVELIDLYWKVGEYVSHKIANDEWGKNTVQALSSYIQLRQPNIRGFSPQNIWRMRASFIDRFTLFINYVIPEVFLSGIYVHNGFLLEACRNDDSPLKQVSTI